MKTVTPCVNSRKIYKGKVDELAETINFSAGQIENKLLINDLNGPNEYKTPTTSVRDTEPTGKLSSKLVKSTVRQQLKSRRNYHYYQNNR